MPAYAYTGLNRDREDRSRGSRRPTTSAALKAALKRQGVYLTAVTETTRKTAAGSRAVGTSGASTAAAARSTSASCLIGSGPRTSPGITRLMSTLLCAGVTLPESLVALTDQVESPRFKNVLSDVGAKVNEGSSLADAIAAHPKVFSKLYINMVRAGEASGSLETVLIRIADFMDQQEDLRSKVTTAMFYPMAMALVGVGVVTLLMVKVVPGIAEMFEGQGAELPFTTKSLI